MSPTPEYSPQTALAPRSCPPETSTLLMDSAADSGHLPGQFLSRRVPGQERRQRQRHLSIGPFSPTTEEPFTGHGGTGGRRRQRHISPCGAMSCFQDKPAKARFACLPDTEPETGQKRLQPCNRPSRYRQRPPYRYSEGGCRREGAPLGPHLAMSF
jgi:hypothetical protein